MSLTAQDKAAVRTSDLFVVLLTRHWLRDAHAQAQAQYAAQLGKPFRVLVWPGVRLPENAFQGVEDLELVHLETTGAEALRAPVKAWLEAWLNRRGEG